MTNFAQHGTYNASLNAFPSVRRYVYAKNVEAKSEGKGRKQFEGGHYTRSMTMRKQFIVVSVLVLVVVFIGTITWAQ